jgi:Domain of unknown function (DUF1707)
MEGPLEPRDPALLRVSDADRHKVAEILRQAAGEGRLDLDELDERLESAYSAKTYADLVPITADLPVRENERLPGPSPRPASPSLPAAHHDTTLAFMGGSTRKGLRSARPTRRSRCGPASPSTCARRGSPATRR